MTTVRLCLFPVLSFVLALFSAVPASAADAVEDFYKKNNLVTLLVGFGSPSGYENWARLVGQYMTKYMPGLRPSWSRPCRAPAA